MLLNEDKYRLINIEILKLTSDLKINKHTITAEELKYLGVTIDKNTSFKHHIDSIKSKIRQSVAYIKKATHTLNKNVKSLLCVHTFPFKLHGGNMG